VKSLASRLFLYVGVGQFIVLALLNVGLWILAQKVFVQDFDERLGIQANSIASLIDQEGPYVEFDYKEELAPRFERVENPDYYQIWVEGVGILDRSTSMGADHLEQRHGTAQAPAAWDGPLPDGREGRFAGIRFAIGEYEPIAEDGKKADRCTAVLVLGTSRAPIDRDMARFGTGLVFLDLLIGLGSTLVVYLSVRRGLRPVEDLASSVRNLDSPNGPDQLANLKLPSELTPLSRSAQDLHRRLAEAIHRERRLSGHIAHELRTPISELRILSEVALAQPEDADGLLVAAEQSKEVALEMERTVAMLLRLWRQKTALAEEPTGPVDVSKLMQSLQGRVSGRSGERGLSWQATASDAIYAQVERRPLELVLSNLMDNAVEHSPPGSEISWSVQQSGNSVFVSIKNEVRGSTQECANGESRHAGLGLSLSHRVSDLTGIELEVDQSEQGWRVELSIPADRVAS